MPPAFCRHSRLFGADLLRPQLLLREIWFSGVLSLIIILVSGLFVGLVLGLQGYETLQRYGSSEALGILVALSLVREWGRWWRSPFVSRAGSAVTAEIGLMKATEQLKAMDMMASIRWPASSLRVSGAASSRCRCWQPSDR